MASQGFRCEKLQGGCLFWHAQGEGEVKIVSRLLRPWAEVGPEDSHAIIASDSDMVLMALMTPLPNLFVLAEPTLTRRAASPMPHQAPLPALTLSLLQNVPQPSCA